MQASDVNGYPSTEFQTEFLAHNEGQTQGLAGVMNRVGLRQGEQIHPIRNTSMDPELVNQIYQVYIQLLARDKTAKIRDVLVQEPFLTLVQQGLISEQHVEVAVFQRLYAEEESADI